MPAHPGTELYHKLHALDSMIVTRVEDVNPSAEGSGPRWSRPTIDCHTYLTNQSDTPETPQADTDDQNETITATVPNYWVEVRAGPLDSLLENRGDELKELNEFVKAANTSLDDGDRQSLGADYEPSTPTEGERTGDYLARINRELTCHLANRSAKWLTGQYRTWNDHHQENKLNFDRRFITPDSYDYDWGYLNQSLKFQPISYVASETMAHERFKKLTMTGSKPTRDGNGDYVYKVNGPINPVIYDMDGIM